MKKLRVLLALIVLLLPVSAFASESKYETIEDIDVVVLDNTMSCDETRDGGKETKEKDYAIIQFRDSNGNVYHGFDGYYVSPSLAHVIKVDQFSPHIIFGDPWEESYYKIENGQAAFWVSSNRVAKLIIEEFSIRDNLYGLVTPDDKNYVLKNCNAEININKVTVPIYFEIEGQKGPYTYDDLETGKNCRVVLLNTPDNAIPSLSGDLKIGKIESSDPNAKITIKDSLKGETSGIVNISKNYYVNDFSGSFYISADRPTTVTLSDFSMELWQVGSREVELINSDTTFTFVFNGEKVYAYFENTHPNSLLRPDAQYVYSGNAITLPTLPDSEGYTFVGWSDGKKTYAPGESVVINEKTKFTTIWERSESANMYTVTYDNAGIGAGLSGNQVKSGTSIQLPSLESPDGYVFKGWTSGGKTYSPGEYVSITSNMTFRAVWEQSSQGETVVITFNNNGIGVSPSQKTVKVNSTIYLPNLGTVGEYAFSGWWDGNVLYNPGAAYTATQNTTLVARWENSNQTYRVEFTNTGENNSIPNIEVDSGSSIQLPKLEDTVDYNFVGWSDGFNSFAPLEYVDINRDTTFIAQWQLKNKTRPSNILMTINQPSMMVDGVSTPIDAAPYIRNDRTYVPIRALGEGFGADVYWDNDSRSVTIQLDGNTVVMNVGSTYYWLNGELQVMDVAPEISGIGRSYVPIRFVAEALGFQVIPTYNFDGTTASVFFSY